MALICDTGPLYSALDRDDPDHPACAALLVERAADLLVPAPVLVEVAWLSDRRMGRRAFSSVLADIAAGALGVVDLVAVDYGRARELVERYADLGLGFVDAAVVAIAERLGERTIATLDRRHFAVVRPRHVEAFVLVPS